MGFKLLIKLAWHSLCFRRGAVVITVAAIAVSVFTLLSVQHLRQTAKESFNSTVSGVDLIVGPRTGDINLLLTSVFRIGNPSQNMSWESYQHLAKHPSVSWTIPISLGDSHRGFRVVGTEEQFFTHFQYGQSVSLNFSKGKAFSQKYELVLGANVANTLHYTTGQSLIISHGLGNTSFHNHDAFPFTVSGILKTTGTPVDNAIYVSLEGLESVHHNESHSPKELEHAEPTSISAAMVGLNSKLSIFKLQREINASHEEPLLAILPGVTLSQLWEMSRGVESVLALMAKLVLFASLLGLAAVMIASLRERNYEISVLRALGSGPLIILILIQLEALLTGLLGVLVGGLIFFFCIILFKGELMMYGIDIGINQISSVHGVVCLYVLIGTLIVGVVPALTGYLRSK